MIKVKKNNQQATWFSHPFVIVFGAIIIVYAGYIFGIKIYELLH